MSGNERPMVPGGCLWPLSYRSFCGEVSVTGRLCVKHLRRVRAYVGRWECAWPGCQRLSPARRGFAPPPAIFTAEVFAEAVRQSKERVCFASPSISSERGSGIIRWGEQLHIRNVTADGAGELTEKAVAFYVGKYATKNTEAMEGLDRSLKAEDAEVLTGRPHIVRLVRTAWAIGQPSQP